MEIQSRLLTVDFYDCKGDRCSTEEALRDQVSDALRTVGLSPIEIISSGQESGVLSLLALVPGGHVALHVHPAMRHVSLDVYLCRENVALDPIAHVLHFSNRTRSRAHICGAVISVHRRRSAPRRRRASPPSARSRARAQRSFASSHAEIVTDGYNSKGLLHEVYGFVQQSLFAWVRITDQTPASILRVPPASSSGCSHRRDSRQAVQP